MPLKVIAGGARPSTVAMYGFMMRVSLPKLGSKRLKDITAVDIMQYLQYLREEYRAPDGRTLSEKSIKHHYDILRIIFNYAEKQEVIEKNPIKKVDAPKTVKRPVEALTQEEEQIFFRALGGYKLEYRCMMLLMATTGIRRGECLGLQWQDFDFQNNTLSIVRNVTYTKESGIMVAEPKTPCSIRTIPLMEGVKTHLLLLRQEAFRRHPNELIKSAYLFEGKEGAFTPRDPNTATRKISAFMKSIGLHGISPHDLRHPYVKHTTKIFSLRLMNFQAQAYPDARRKTRGACQLHRGGQSKSLVRLLCNRKQFSCLPPQSKISRILYAISIRLSGYTSTRSISSSASSVVSVSASKSALDASLRLSCRACSSCFCFACANTAA